MLSMMLRILDSVLFASSFTLMQANRVVEREIAASKPEAFEDDKRLQHGPELLDQFLTQSVQRLERIENKAMGTLLGVAAAVAVSTAGYGLVSPSGALSGKPFEFKVAAAASLAAAMIYLVASGLLALDAYRVGKVYRPLLDDRAPMVKPRRQGQVILWCIEQNERVGTIRSNRLSSAFDCLRNGLILMLVGGLSVLSVSIT